MTATHKFEVPYNFDIRLIAFYKKNEEYINFIFLPPFKDDLPNTRTIIESDVKEECYMPQTREEYESHLKHIKESGVRFVVLWQVLDNLISKDMLDYYVNLGASGFIISNDVNAKRIKDYDSNLLVISSIVRRIKDGISKIDFSSYDYIVLYYPFNRSLNVLKELKEIQHKLVIMPNTVCHADCPAMHHWFPKEPFIQDEHCMSMKNIKNCAWVYPEHLDLFDPYVGGYKLQGREYPTDIIEEVCEAFFTRKSSPTLLEGDIDSKLKDFQKNMSLDDYYNIKSKEIKFL
ncbi:MAG: hypothetical protein MJZ33_05920 [Paludibacteraceae bacterium]|nr:hypothetical protein [Paludibacteraceae bacterium]